MPQRGTERIFGAGGANLASVYDRRPQSYKGMTFTGFPNFFLFLGAFSIPGNQSAIYVIEAQTRYIVDAIRTMRGRRATRVEVRAERQEAFVSRSEERSVGTVWLEGGCRSYYQTPDGRNAGLWPDWSFRYAKETRHSTRTPTSCRRPVSDRTPSVPIPTPPEPRVPALRHASWSQLERSVVPPSPLQKNGNIRSIIASGDSSG